MESSNPNAKPLSSEIFEHLDKLVVGQVEAKERLSLLLSMHSAWDAKSDPYNPPPNGIIVGPTGSGKTFSIRVASMYLGFPFRIIDATTLVPSGARGGSSAFDLFGEFEDVPKLVLFVDEFDKIAARDDDHNKAWKSDIQRALLKFIENRSSARVDGNKVDALVLAGGAFVGIDGPENLRRRRTEIMQLMRDAPKGTVVAEDFVNFGFMPELVARLPAIIQYDHLPYDALVQILKHPESSPLLIWEHHFRRIGKTLRFTQRFVEAVAKRAVAQQMGARGLQQIVFPALARRAYVFESSQDSTIDVGEEVLEYKKGP
jgi:ATP-dependent Clp protease ATP-binding subunit ClpX